MWQRLGELAATVCAHDPPQRPSSVSWTPTSRSCTTNPEAGGWTIESNLQCACAFNHELKTVGLWHAGALPGMAILWTGPRGDRHLTLPAGGLTPVPAAHLDPRNHNHNHNRDPDDRDDPPS